MYRLGAVQYSGGNISQKWRQILCLVSACCLALAVGGILASVFAALLLNNAQQSKVKAAFEVEATKTHRIFERSLEVYGNIARSVGDLYENLGQVSHDQFRVFAARILAETVGVQGIAWNPWIKEQDLPHFLQTSQQLGVPINISSFVADWDDQSWERIYVPNGLEEPNEGDSNIWMDRTSNSEQRAALISASSSCEVAATPTITLPTVTDQRIVFLFSAIYNKTAANQTALDLIYPPWTPCFESENWRENNVIGVATVVLRLADMFVALTQTIDSTVYFRVYNKTNIGATIEDAQWLIYSNIPGDGGGNMAVAEIVPKSIAVGDQTWTVIYILQNLETNNYTSTLVRWIGILITLVVVGIIGLTARHQFQILQKIAVAKESKTLRLTIASIADMMLILDHNDDVTFCNDIFAISIGCTVKDIISNPASDFIIGLPSSEERMRVAVRVDPSDPAAAMSGPAIGNPAITTPSPVDKLGQNQHSTSSDNTFLQNPNINPTKNPVNSSSTKASAVECHKEVKVKRRNGTIFPADVSYSPSSKEAITVLILRDLSERKRMMKTLEDAQKEAVSANHMKTDFLSFICHELRNPLHAITGLNEHVVHLIGAHQCPSMDKADVDESLRGIESCVTQMRAIVDDVLDLHKIETGNMHFEFVPVDLSTLLSQVALQRPEPAPGVTFAIDNHMTMHHQVYFTDPTRLSQVLLNLIGNALKFTKKGRVVVSLELVSNSNSSGPLGLLVNSTSITHETVTIGIPLTTLPINHELALERDLLPPSVVTSTGSPQSRRGEWKATAMNRQKLSSSESGNSAKGKLNGTHHEGEVQSASSELTELGDPVTIHLGVTLSSINEPHSSSTVSYTSEVPSGPPTLNTSVSFTNGEIEPLLPGQTLSNRAPSPPSKSRPTSVLAIFGQVSSPSALVSPTSSAALQMAGGPPPLELKSLMSKDNSSLQVPKPSVTTNAPISGVNIPPTPAQAVAPAVSQSPSSTFASANSANPLGAHAIPAPGGAAGVNRNEIVVGEVTDRIRFSVQDTGIGMSDEARARLFQPYVQVHRAHTQFHGTGLGLSIVSKLVHALGGQVMVESEPDKGSTFSFELPMKACFTLMPPRDVLNATSSLSLTMSHGRQSVTNNTAQGNRPAAGGSISLLTAMPSTNPRGSEGGTNKKKMVKTGSGNIVVGAPGTAASSKPDTPLEYVLICEDVHLNQKLLLRMLADSGYKLEIANNGQEAVEQIRQDLIAQDADRGRGWRAGRGRCACVLMDLSMPVMDGFEATLVLRKLGYIGPIIAMSGNAIRADVQRFTGVGGTAFLSKPFNKKDIITAMEQQLDKSSFLDLNRGGRSGNITILAPIHDMAEIDQKKVDDKPDDSAPLLGSREENAQQNEQGSHAEQEQEA